MAATNASIAVTCIICAPVRASAKAGMTIIKETSNARSAADPTCFIKKLPLRIQTSAIRCRSLVLFRSRHLSGLPHYCLNYAQFEPIMQAAKPYKPQTSHNGGAWMHHLGNRSKAGSPETGCAPIGANGLGALYDRPCTAGKSRVGPCWITALGGRQDRCQQRRLLQG